MTNWKRGGDLWPIEHVAHCSKCWAATRKMWKPHLKGPIETKHPGPDNISGRLLKVYHKQLAGVFCDLSNCSLAKHSIPAVWTSSITCPVPKRARYCNSAYLPFGFNIFSDEGLWKADSPPATTGSMLLHRSTPVCGVDDALLTLLLCDHTHLEKPRT